MEFDNLENLEIMITEERYESGCYRPLMKPNYTYNTAIKPLKHEAYLNNI
jgi:hypothetical protein